MALYKTMRDLLEDEKRLVAACRKIKTIPIYTIRLFRRDQPVAILAPHGGKIEPGTSQIAEGIAGSQYNFFGFEGDLENTNDDINNFDTLHVTSTAYDAPDCLLNLISTCNVVVAIHGADNLPELKAKDYGVYVGGLDAALKVALFNELNGVSNQLSGNDRKPFAVFVLVNRQHDIPTVASASKIYVDDEKNDRRYRNYGGLDENNICNCGKGRKGAQLEITRRLRNNLARPPSSANDLPIFVAAIQRAIATVTRQSPPAASGLIRA